MPKSEVRISPEVRNDPVEFARKLLKNPDGTPVEPHCGQIELLHGIAETTVVRAGRQWGKSVSMSWYIAWYMVTHPHRQVYIVAPTVDQSRIIFNEVAYHFRTTLKSVVKKNITEYPFPHITLLNGTECHGRGANSPQFIRGKKAHLIVVDEAAFVKDKTITDVIEPMLTVTIREKDSGLLLISTPFGLGAFYDYYQAAQADTSGASRCHHFTSLDNPHADKARLLRIRDRVGEGSMVWQTEYMAEFAGDDMAVFKREDIIWAYEHFPQKEFPIPNEDGHRYLQGVDLANRRDWFVAVVGDVTDKSLCVLSRIDRYQKKGYPFYKEVIRTNYRRYNSCKTLVDATTLGESVVQELSDIGADGYTIGTNAAKHEIVQELARMFQEHRLAIPFDQDIIREFYNFAYDITPAKVVRMEAKEGHDDIVMACALLAHLACIPTSLGTFQGVSLSQSGSARTREKAKQTAYSRDPWHDLWNEE